MIEPMSIDQRSLVAGILAAAAVLLVVSGAAMLRAERAFTRRLRFFIAANAGDVDELDEAVPTRSRTTLVQRLNAAFAHSRVNAEVRRHLIRAGSPLHPNQFIYLRLISTAIGGPLFFALALQLPPVWQIVIGLCGLVAGWMIPMVIIRAMQRRRLAAFERHLPDAIDIMAGSLEAGSSLPMALEMVAREIPPPVSTEFSRALREVSLGMSLDDALLNMLDRVRSEDLDMLATAVAIQFRVGGNLADVLKVIAHTIRERVRIRGDIRTLTAQQSISANILTVLPIGLAVFLFILNPSYEMRLFEPGLPQAATISALFMVILAYFVLKRIVSIDA
jgi:tight adherence protein B